MPQARLIETHLIHPGFYSFGLKRSTLYDQRASFDQMRGRISNYIFEVLHPVRAGVQRECRLVGRHVRVSFGTEVGPDIWRITNYEVKCLFGKSGK